MFEHGLWVEASLWHHSALFLKIYCDIFYLDHKNRSSCGLDVELCCVTVLIIFR